jgi:hypothetical protein
MSDWDFQYLATIIVLAYIWITARTTQQEKAPSRSTVGAFVLFNITFLVCMLGVAAAFAIASAPLGRPWEEGITPNLASLGVAGYLTYKAWELSKERIRAPVMPTSPGVRQAGIVLVLGWAAIGGVFAWHYGLLR